MSHDSSERDAAERLPHAEGGSWPVKGFDGTERQTTYIGMASHESGDADIESTALVYDERDETVFQAVIDEDNQRLVPKNGTERELESDGSLAETLAAFGDRLEWDSLSEFARERLQDADESRKSAPEPITFTRSNTSAAADHNLEFSGSYRYRTTGGQVRTVERTLEVTLDDSDDPARAAVDVTEQVTQSTALSNQQDRADAARLGTSETAFTIDLTSAATEGRLEAVIEEWCQEWHIPHVALSVEASSEDTEPIEDRSTEEDA
ncbi:hypothetical protein [Halopiger aswanensis]|uniref:Uncharacterized protein n=1 Tax=Halopiger aswanensis TaxID=148449 RepID=A0A419WR83_9EURY|nr:hypothetical protein [Halopiger aswanensis]RKD98003.1 hypothetical protein ATJ93_1002 [Halopiger aswanensis]